jgi:GxxExxY protein
MPERTAICIKGSVQPGEQLIADILKAARQVHSTLGPGFLESIYSRALAVELKNNNFRIERERTIRIWYGSQPVGKHRLDLVVDGRVIVELKANHGIVAVHVAQMRSYLHATNYAFGVILNFGMPELEWELIPSPDGQAEAVDP